ncbi:MAG TPA: alpha/beta fold hydrolase [Pilimelia sp.]|nr:alpha/beta fold hydrolase [Pilimelia sp.]
MTDLLSRPTHPAAGAVPSGSPVARLWRDRRTRAAVAVLACAVAGWLSALGMPRGPQRPGDVVVTILTGAAVGFLTGFALRSRWSVLVGPAVFAVAFEIGRAGVTGPSVDRPRLTVSLGVFMFVLGRVFNGLVVLAPMAIGAIYGAALARRARGTAGHGNRLWRYGRAGLTALVALALVALGVLLTRPGTTAPIAGADGRPLPGSVAELTRVRLGGHDQTVLIRARSAAAPVLLYLSGGPGQSDLGYTRAYMPTMEDSFVFAVWDQRGSGTSYDALDPTRTWTLDRAVSDTIELTDYLRRRFDEQKIYLFGNSWGSTLGVLAAQRRPDLFHAYIGAGQMVSQRESDQIIYRDMVDHAARTGDTGLAEKLRAWGEPPYRDRYAYVNQIEYYDRIGPYDKTDWYTSHRPAGLDGNGVSEYGPLDKVNKLKALFDMAWVMYPQLQTVDFRRDAPALSIPVYLIQGAHELRGRLQPAREWYEALAAPHKEWITFEKSGHIPQFEEFSRFQRTLTEVVVPQTYR